MTRNAASPLASFGALSPSHDSPRASSTRVTGQLGDEVHHGHQGEPDEDEPRGTATRQHAASVPMPLAPLLHPDFLRITHLAAPFTGPRRWAIRNESSQA